MLSNRLAVVILAAACVTAAGVGGYVASRQNIPAAEARSVAPGPAAVEETEALVTAPAPAPAPNPVPAPPAPAAARTPSKRNASPPAAKPAARAEAARPQPPMPTLDRTWPAPSPAAPAVDSASSVPAASAPPEVAEPVRPPEPPAKTYTELVVATDSVIGFQTETALSSERARVEDRVEAKVIRDVLVGGEVAIPAGTRALGVVTVVERGGRFKEKARLGIRFQSLVLADGTRLPVTTDTIYRYGDAPGNGTAARVGGGAVAGAILGAIIGGGKGAAIGAATGAGAGTASVMSSDRSEAVIPAGAEVTARVLTPVSVTVERE